MATPIWKEFKRIIWDWNGTLLDDKNVCVEIMNDCLGRRNLPLLTLGRYLDIFEFPVVNYYRKLGFDLHTESFEKVGMEFIDSYQKKMVKCALHADVHSFLRKVKDQSIPQYILSALNETNLKKVLDHFRLKDFFEEFRGLPDHFASGKIELGKELLANWDSKKEKTVLIGDTVHDFETAKSLGIDCILVACGHNSFERLSRCGTPVFRSLSDFL